MLVNDQGRRRSSTTIASRLFALLEKFISRYGGRNFLAHLALGQHQKCWKPPTLELPEQRFLLLSMLRIDAHVKDAFQILLNLRADKRFTFQSRAVLTPVDIKIESHWFACFFLFA